MESTPGMPPPPPPPKRPRTLGMKMLTGAAASMAVGGGLCGLGGVFGQQQQVAGVLFIAGAVLFWGGGLVLAISLLVMLAEAARPR